MKTTLQSAARSTGRFILLHRHDIADALMVVAAFLKFWPPTDYLSNTQNPRRTQRKNLSA